MAGGLGWGIRGQYGHETGAMIAGLLVGLVIVFLVAGDRPAAFGLRAAAWCTVGMGFGGSMTYGQTVGLTHDPAMVGNGAALAWGLLGLALKGGLWIGFAGALLGLGLGGTRLGRTEMLRVMAGLLVLAWVGIQCCNRPFDPSQRVLPPLYFSADWRWAPDAPLKPRPEVWGGLLFALIGFVAYFAGRRGDPLVARLAAWGFLGGALGFPLGQCLQAGHAWNRAFFAQPPWAAMDACMNWWNWMETTFGLLLGAFLGLGTWLHRDRVAAAPREPSPALPGALEVGLLVTHLGLVAGVEFTDLPVFSRLYDFGLQLGFIPAILLATGRHAPPWLLFPGVLLPIAGKTLERLVYEQHALGTVPGWLVYFATPMLVAAAAAGILARRAADGRVGRGVLGPALLLAVALYFGLNFAFFDYPWPWRPWTARTPNALAFAVFALGLVLRTGPTLASRGPRGCAGPSREPDPTG